MSDDVLDIIQQLFQRRLGAYPTTLEVLAYIWVAKNAGTNTL